MRHIRLSHLSLLSFILSFMTATFSFSHSGHEHDAPKVIRARKGGVIKRVDSLEGINIETVVKGKLIKIYVYDSAMIPITPGDYLINASASAPRSAKTVGIQLELKGEHLEGIYDAKGAHRYSLKLDINHVKNKKYGSAIFTIEPRK